MWLKQTYFINPEYSLLTLARLSQLSTSAASALSLARAAVSSRSSSTIVVAVGGGTICCRPQSVSFQSAACGEERELRGVTCSVSVKSKCTLIVSLSLLATYNTSVTSGNLKPVLRRGSRCASLEQTIAFSTSRELIFAPNICTVGNVCELRKVYASR